LLVPKAAVIGVLVNPSYDADLQVREVQTAAVALGLKLEIARASTEAEIDKALTTLVKQGVAALFVANDPYFDSHRDQIIGVAARDAIPAMYYTREYAASGGLVSYGSNIADAYRQAGIYTGKILRGAKPADLPVMQPTKFELVINLTTAKALGLQIPPTLLALADEVIE
jgi:putative ABC transport system substrate-binding protein